MEQEAGEDSGLTLNSNIDGKHVSYTIEFDLLNLNDSARKMLDIDDESLKPSNFVDSFEKDGFICK